MRAWIVWLVVAVVVAVAGCGDDRGRAARERYNAGVAKLEGGALDEAEREFLAARDLARFDDEVRFRATFDLASVAIARAEAAASAQPPKSAEAIAAYDRARTWLTDAVRRRPDDADARANLERVEARLLALVDAAGAGANKLEARLDRAISTQRSGCATRRAGCGTTRPRRAAIRWRARTSSRPRRCGSGPWRPRSARSPIWPATRSPRSAARPRTSAPTRRRCAWSSSRTSICTWPTRARR
jgi:hypothetical protein